jgi:hypothetical protein
MKLVSQIMKYKSGDAPYDLPFAGDYMTPKLWWQTTEDCVGSELKTLANRLLSITPHSAACERTFSILGWIHTKARNRLLVSRLENMGNMYMYNISHQRSDSTNVSVAGASSQSSSIQDVRSNSLGYYAEYDDRDMESDDLGQTPIHQLTPLDNDHAAWSAVKSYFDLQCPEFQVASGGADTSAPDAVAEETAENEDETNFSISEVIGQCLTSGRSLATDEHSYA